MQGICDECGGWSKHLEPINNWGNLCHSCSPYTKADHLIDMAKEKKIEELIDRHEQEERKKKEKEEKQ